MIGRQAFNDVAIESLPGSFEQFAAGIQTLLVRIERRYQSRCAVGERAAARVAARRFGWFRQAR
jgi:hypothetical protein